MTSLASRMGDLLHDQHNASQVHIMWTSLALGVGHSIFMPGNGNYYISQKLLLCHFSAAAARSKYPVPVIFVLLHEFG